MFFLTKNDWDEKNINVFQYPFLFVQFFLRWVFEEDFALLFCIEIFYLNILNVVFYFELNLFHHLELFEFLCILSH